MAAYEAYGLELQAWKHPLPVRLAERINCQTFMPSTARRLREQTKSGVEFAAFLQKKVAWGSMWLPIETGDDRRRTVIRRGPGAALLQARGVT